MTHLAGKIAVVTGATRGIGKGIALGLGEAGATVYVTGRTADEGGAALAGSVATTAAEISSRGGVGIAVRCDHRDDEEVAKLFDQIAREQRGLDVLVNNAFGTPRFDLLWGSRRYWEVPVSLWDDMIDVGLRSHYVAAWHAARMMVRQGSGLIINVASHAAGTAKSERSRVLLAYSVGKAALRRMTSDMAVELRSTGVTVLEIWPPATRTEAVLADPELFGDLSAWREPIFTGRVVAALARSGDIAEHSGKSLVVEELATQFGIPHV